VPVRHQMLRAPHQPPDLPPRTAAVYVFSLSAGTQSPAGPGRVLKVGMVNANSGPRFKYQHYKEGSTGSTLAGAVRNNRVLWTYLGVRKPVGGYGEWLKRHTDRDHFFVDARYSEVVPLLEVYLKGQLGPVFEGSMKKHPYSSRQSA